MIKTTFKLVSIPSIAIHMHLLQEYSLEIFSLNINKYLYRLVLFTLLIMSEKCCCAKFLSLCHILTENLKILVEIYNKRIGNP